MIVYHGYCLPETSSWKYFVTKGQVNNDLGKRDSNAIYESEFLNEFNNICLYSQYTVNNV